MFSQLRFCFFSLLRPSLVFGAPHQIGLAELPTDVLMTILSFIPDNQNTHSAKDPHFQIGHVFPVKRQGSILTIFHKAAIA